jgi:hypothetical protein
MKNNHTFITSSLPLAAYLVASGELRMREVRLTDPKRAVFVFNDEQERGPELERKFAAGAVVSALAFHVQLRILRRAIDNEIHAVPSALAMQEDHLTGKHHVNYGRLPKR